MTRLMRSLLLTLILFGCVQVPPVSVQTAPTGFPENVRWDLVAKLISWRDQKGQIPGPPDFCSGYGPKSRTLTVGALIDRFGSDDGTFFSSEGESYRSLPYPMSSAKWTIGFIACSSRSR